MADAYALVRMAVGSSWPRALRVRAAAVVSTVVARVPPARLPRLDEGVRDMGWGREVTGIDSWAALSPADLPAAVPNMADPTPLYGLLSCHRSGYVREAAIARLATAPGGLRWLLLRVNDWVAPVRIRALTAITERFEGEQPGEVMACLPLVFRLLRLSRMDHRGLVKRFVDRLGDISVEALGQGFEAGDRYTKRAVLRWMSESGRIHPELVARGIDDDDLVVRLRAAALVGECPEEHAEVLRERLCWNRSSRLRVQGFELLLQAGSRRLLTWMRRGIDDVDRDVRKLASEWWRQRHPGFDLLAHYRAEIDAGRATPGKLRGLAAAGEPADWERLVECLDARPAVAREALEAMRRLDAEGSRECRMMMVDDERGGVSRVATYTLVHEVRASDEPVLREYLGSEHRHVRRRAMRLVSNLTRWRPGLVLLEADLDAEDDESRYAALDRWATIIGSYRAEVTGEEARALRRLLQRHPNWPRAPRVLQLLEIVEADVSATN